MYEKRGVYKSRKKKVTGQDETSFFHYFFKQAHGSEMAATWVARIFPKSRLMSSLNII